MQDFSYFYSIPYISIYSLVLFLFFSLSKNKKTIIIVKANKIYDVFKNLSLFYILVIFIGFRGYVFTDWRAYDQMYSSLPVIKNGVREIIHYFNNNVYGKMWESGFILFAIICKSINHNYFFLQFISFLLDFFVLFSFFKRYLKQYYILGFVFYLVFSGLTIEINLLRNSKSIMLFILSIKYINKQKIISYLLLNIFGMFFHTTSLLFIPLFFLQYIPINKKIILFLFLLGNSFYLIRITWITGILEIISKIPYFRLFSIISSYLGSEHFTSSYGITISYLEKIITFLIVYINQTKILKIDKHYNFFVKIVYLYIITYLFCSELKIISDRILILFTFSYWIIYPVIYKSLSKRNKYVFLFIFISYSVARFLHNNSVLYYYNNVLFMKKTKDDLINSINTYYKHNSY